MPLTLRVDGARWREHLRTVAQANPGLVPVIKGNGYGFTNPRLARKAAWLGVTAVAVGTYEELPEVATRFGGDLLVLTPWRPFTADVEAGLAGRVVHTLGRLDDVEPLLARQPDARVVLELSTSMLRHGFSARDLWEAADLLVGHRRVRVEGVALHLPLAQGSHLGEVRRLMDDVVAARLDRIAHQRPAIWVSHLTESELAELRGSFADYEIRPRIGTQLWLGARDALHVGATVLDVHPVRRGDAFGYRGRTAPKAGHLLVVSGGTAHGIGLEAPVGDSSMRARATTLARGGLDAAGFVRSPFSVDGKARLFAEPPHMQASMLFLPGSAEVPAVGEEIDVRVRYTATAFDSIIVS